MVTVMQSYMDLENPRSYIDELYSSDNEKCLDAIVQLKNSVIGSNRQKASVIQQGVVPRLVQLLMTSATPVEVQIEVSITLGSLAMGTEENVKALVDAGVVPLLINGLGTNNPRLIEVCLCCLRSICQYPFVPVELFYVDVQLIPHLLSLMMESVSNQLCVATILGNTCKTAEQQNLLCRSLAIGSLAELLCSPYYKVQMPSLNAIASMCYKNDDVSALVATTSFGGKSIPDLLVGLISHDKTIEMQLASARCLTYMHRAGAITAEDPKILYKALPCLVRMCKKENDVEIRILGAEALAYLTEVDTDLQRVASISNHLISTMAEYLKYQPTAVGMGLGVTSGGGLTHFQAQQMSKKLEQEVKIAQDMKQAAYRVFASLGANDEDIRKKIIETESLMKHVMASLQDNNPQIRLAAVRCLHSLSRSVQQLRTTFQCPFQDHSVWKPLMKLLQNSCNDMLTAASSTLCNLLLEFSPSKEAILDSGAMELLCNLTRHSDPALRLNGIWALMNMAFQADQKIKIQILNTLQTEQIFRLLADSNIGVLMKTLGLLRNLLSTKPHIDHIMGLHGKDIMQVVTHILDEDNSVEVKEQALCILANIADGDTAKEFIMGNDEVIRRLTVYMAHSNMKLQIAATFCISNLVWSEEDGSSARQIKLKEAGVYKILQQLLTTGDTTLFDKVKTALQQFT